MVIISIDHIKMFFKCDYCTELFSRMQYLNKHINEVHRGHDSKPEYVQSLLHTIESDSNLPMTIKNGIIRIVPHNAFGNYVRNIVFYKDDGTDIKIPCQFFDAAKQLIMDTLEILKNENCLMKITSTLCIRFVKESIAEQTDNAFFSMNAIQLPHYDLDHVINTLLLKIDNYDSRGSNWKIQNTNFFRLYVVKTR